MATTKLEPTVLEQRTWKGCYDFTFEAKLIEHKGKHYVICDRYCGQNTLEGGCPRPFLYQVPVAKLSGVREAFQNPDEMVTDTDTNWDCMVEFDLPTFPFGKRLSTYSWAKGW